jgi:hypothetical protein
MRLSLTAISLSVGCLVALTGCAVPVYDVPRVNGEPTVDTIIKRITCELVDLIKTEPTPSYDPPSWHEYNHRAALAQGNGFQVYVTLSLSVIGSGGLAPSFTFPSPPKFSFGAGLNFTKRRTQTFRANLLFSIPELETVWKRNHAFGACPSAETPLAGDLGIEDIATLGLASRNLNLAKEDEVFGGSIEFDIVYGVSSLGPTWTLVHFSGPGGLGSLSHENKDTLTLAFVQVKKPGSATAKEEASQRAREFVNQLLLDRLGSELSR